MRFSSRLPWDAPTNPLLAAFAAKRAAGQTILDLTETNPTRAFDLSPFIQSVPLAQPEASVYNPSPRGLPSARAVIADYYRSHGQVVDPETLLLTASTSEAYSYLFKLLCNPGDEILAPQPSYPLLDFLTGLDSVTPVYYRLRYDDTTGWRINFDYLHQVISPLTRAIVVVNPNNPTGSYLHPADLLQLNALCTQHNLALIVDEVFLDYGDAAGKTTIGNTGALTFVLSGLSKIVAAPQVKLGWIQISGREADIQQSIARLDFIADTYLSASTPAQLAAPALLAQRSAIQQLIIERLRRNETWLRDQPGTNYRILPREGGWCLILEFNDALSDDDRALQLLERHNVFIHPGYFYDFAREGYVVLSLLTAEDIFQAGVAKLVSHSK
jgi:alanine-synthesizing transaminase